MFGIARLSGARAIGLAPVRARRLCMPITRTITKWPVAAATVAAPTHMRGQLPRLNGSVLRLFSTESPPPPAQPASAAAKPAASPSAAVPKAESATATAPATATANTASGKTTATAGSSLARSWASVTRGVGRVRIALRRVYLVFVVGGSIMTVLSGVYHLTTMPKPPSMGPDDEIMIWLKWIAAYTNPVYEKITVVAAAVWDWLRKAMDGGATAGAVLIPIWASIKTIAGGGSSDKPKSLPSPQSKDIKALPPPGSGGGGGGGAATTKAIPPPAADDSSAGGRRSITERLKSKSKDSDGDDDKKKKHKKKKRHWWQKRSTADS